MFAVVLMQRDKTASQVTVSGLLHSSCRKLEKYGYQKSIHFVAGSETTGIFFTLNLLQCAFKGDEITA
jgi:hypothetical protein